MPIEDSFSPVLHRINQAVKERAIYPDEQVSKPADILVKYSRPPQELLEASETRLKKLIEVADVKKGNSPKHVMSGVNMADLFSSSKGERKEV
jgi:ATP-dependent DNA helicase 2 subunit 2